jgi:hypothetical protein
MKFALKDPMLVSARVEGERGAVRELSAVLDLNAPYCTILAQDAIDLGYSQGGNKHSDQERLTPERVPRVAGMQGIQRGILVKIRRVSIGPLVARDVDALVLELEHPRFIPFDFVLGRTFLKDFKLTVEIGKGYVSLQ